MSFVEKTDVYNIVESFVTDLVTNLVTSKNITVNFMKLKVKEAIDIYGSDKPDLRFGMKFVDMTENFKNSNFGVFKNTVENN
jgi:aspartyl-tRNA synthetase